MTNLRSPSTVILTRWLVNEWTIPSIPNNCLDVILTLSPICSGLVKSSGSTGCAATGSSCSSLLSLETVSKASRRSLSVETSPDSTPTSRRSSPLCSRRLSILSRRSASSLSRLSKESSSTYGLVPVTLSDSQRLV